MALINVRATRVVTPTATGNQDITISGFGTPKAVFFILPATIADATPNNNALYSFGATDGTRQWSTAVCSRNNSASTSTFKRGMTDKCISTLQVTGSVLGEAGFVSFITDGIRINWTSVATVGYYMTVVMFNGTDLTARVDTISLGTSTSAQTYSSLSGEADLIISNNVGSPFNDSLTNDLATVLGFTHNNRAGTITQRCIGISEDNAVADGQPFAQMMDDKSSFRLNPPNGAVDYEVSLSNFTSSGFDFTCSSNAGSDDLGILALSLGGGASSVGTYQPPVTATTSTISESFTPQFSFLGLNTCVSVDTLEGDGDAGTFGLSAIDGTAQYCSTLAIEDLSAITDTQTVSNDQAVDLPAHDGTVLYTGTLSSLNSSGVNLSFSNVSGTSRMWIYMDIEQSVAAAKSFLIRQPSSTIRAMLRR